MELAEIIKLGRDLLKLLSEYDVKLQDWKYVDMYEQYKRMRKAVMMVGDPCYV